MTERETAFVLPEDAVASSGPVNIPGVPGTWTPGEPIGVSSLPVDLKEMRDLVKETGAPLKETKANAPAANHLDRTGGMVSGAEFDSSEPQPFVPFTPGVTEVPAPTAPAAATSAEAAEAGEG